MSSAEKSTTVRTVMGPLRRGLRWARALSPDLAARMAYEVFTTPRRHTRPAREREILASAEPLFLGDGSIRAWTWGSGPVVALVHGWEGRGAQLGAFVEPLVARGFQVVTFDAPGHGDSEGRHSSLLDFADAVLALGRRVGPLHAVIAHSMGAPSVTVALARGLSAERVAFIAPPSSVRDRLETFVDFLELPRSVAGDLGERMERRYGVSPAAIEVSALAPGMTAPLLLVHDADDVEVPAWHSAEYARYWPTARVKTVSGLGHRKILRDPQVVSAVVDHVAAGARTSRGASDLERWLAA